MSKKKATQKSSRRNKSPLNNNSSQSQCQRLLEWLKIYLRLNTFEIQEQLNIVAPAARVLELKKAGHIIHTFKISAKNRDGFIHHGIAQYVLIKLAGGENV